MKESNDDEAFASTDCIATSTSSGVTLGSKPTPPLWHPISEVQCLDYYTSTYSRFGVTTFDGIHVRFAGAAFKHAFFVSPDKTRFSQARGERVRWIDPVLTDRAAFLFCGYEKRRDRYSRQRRVAIWPDRRYIVIIIIEQGDPRRAHFLTAWYIDGPKWERTLNKLVGSPKW